MTTLRLAIVGAGPAGIYAADILLRTERDFDVSIDLFEKLPAPYGLVRYGVAPDHPRIKGVVNALRDVLDRGDIRIFGNVTYGEDITLDDLKKHYNAVIFSTGAIRDAALDIPGIDAKGSFGAADFVSWYDGHPDVPRTWTIEGEHVGMIGNGNVALDAARILAKHADDLLPTEIPQNVYDVLKASPVTDVHVFGRRGPAQVKFTPLELRELGDMNDVDVVVYDEDFDYDEASREAIATNKQVKVIDRVLQKWRERPSANGTGGEVLPPPAPALLGKAGSEDRRRRQRHRSRLRADHVRRRWRGRGHGRGRATEALAAVPRRRVLRIRAAGPAVRRAPRLIPSTTRARCSPRTRTTPRCPASTRPAGSSAAQSA